VDISGRMQKGRNGVILNLVGSGRQSTGDREYFHKIPTLALCRALWDNIYEAHHSWELDDKLKENEDQKWEKFDVDNLIWRKRILMDVGNVF
jgi:hypothetical protein